MAPRSQLGAEIAIRCKVETNRGRTVPVRRDLENRGPADAVVREKHIFAERLLRAASGGNHLGRDPCEIAPAPAVAFAKGERDQGGTWGYDLQTELPGQIVTK